MVNEKIINGFCYKHGNKVIFIDLITEKKTEYDISEFLDYITKQNIDETSLILSNREGSFVTPLFKSPCLTYLKKRGKNRLCEFNKDELVDLCYKVCILLQQKSKI